MQQGCFGSLSNTWSIINLLVAWGGIKYVYPKNKSQEKTIKYFQKQPFQKWNSIFLFLVISIILPFIFGSAAIKMFMISIYFKINFRLLLTKKKAGIKLTWQKKIKVILIIKTYLLKKGRLFESQKKTQIL